MLQSDRGITYARDVPAGSRVVDGEWWAADYSGPPLVSFEKKIADGLGLKLGDEVTVNVLGRNITARIANLRTLDWQILGINFVLVYSPNAFRGAPHTHIATLTFPGGGTAQDEAALLKAVADRVSVRHHGAGQGRARRVRPRSSCNLVLAMRGASAITLIAAALVLGGALAAGHRHRVYDAVILKTLGATRPQLLGAYALEYLLIGGAPACSAWRPDRSPPGGSSPSDEFALRLAARAGAGARLRGGRGHGRSRACRHVHGARPEARAGLGICRIATRRVAA